VTGGGLVDHPDRRARGVGFHAGAAVVAVVLALAETWPLATRLATTYPIQGDWTTGAIPATANDDQLLISWILASNARRLATDPLGVFDTNNMHPFRRTLAFSESFLGVTIPVWPAQAIWQNPVLTSNLALLFTLALSAYGVLLLVHELTGSLGAALVAATLATYAPLVWGRIDQLHVVSGQCAALAFFALVRVVRTRAWRYATLLGVLAAWQAWASLHWGFFLALGLASAVLVLLIASRDARRALPQLIAAAGLAGVLTVPLALPYVAMVREMDLADRGFVAFLRNPRAAFPPFTGSLAERIMHGERARAGLMLTPWLAMATGVVVSLAVRRPRSVAPALVAAIAAGVVMNFWLACGSIKWLGVPSLYGMLASVPGLGILRVPARAVSYVNLMLAVLAGCGTAAVLHRLGSRAARLAVVAVVIGLGVVEAGWNGGGLVAAPALALPVPPALARLPPDCAIAEIPTHFRVQAQALFRSTAHWRPLLNGRSGFYPVSVFAEAAFLNRFPEDQALEYLRAAGVCAVLVRLDAPASRRMLSKCRQRGLRLRSLTMAYDAMLIVLDDAPPAPPAPPAGAPLARTAWRIVEPANDTRALLDGSLATLRTFRVGGPGAPERLTIDLGGAEPVSGIDLALGTHFRRYLWSYRIEGSPDGTTWSTLAERPSAVPPFESYRADPTRIVQRLRFPLATTRFLRIGPYRQPPGSGLGPDVGFTTWGVAEIDVLGRSAAPEEEQAQVHGSRNG
jgi:hypothetical protein